MLDEFRPGFRHLRRGIEVIILLRQGQSALSGRNYNHAAVLWIGSATETEDSRNSILVKVCDRGGDILWHLDRVDALEVRLQRRRAGLLYCGLVHTRRIVVADELKVAPLRRLFLCRIL